MAAKKQEVVEEKKQSLWSATSGTIKTSANVIADTAESTGKVLKYNLDSAVMLSLEGKAHATLSFQEAMEELRSQIDPEQVKKDVEFLANL